MLPISKTKKVNSKENTASILSLYFFKKICEIGFPHDLQFCPLKDNGAPQCSQEISKAEQRSAKDIDQSNKRAKNTSTNTNRVVASITPAMIKRIFLRLAPSDISSQSYFCFDITTKLRCAAIFAASPLSALLGLFTNMRIHLESTPDVNEVERGKFVFWQYRSGNDDTRLVGIHLSESFNQINDRKRIFIVQSVK